MIAFPVRRGSSYAATTRKNGTYTLRHVRPGRYEVSFASDSCPNGSNWLPQVYRDHTGLFDISGNAFTVSSGKLTTGINGSLRLGSEISGTVTSASGRRLARVCVETGRVDGYYIGINAETTRNGSYHLHALFPGKYVLNFSACGATGNYAPATHPAVRIGYGQDVSGIDVALATGGTITGTVTLGSSSGQPLAGICVYATNNGGFSFTTGADGSYRVTDLGTGTYQLQFEPGCNNNGNYASASATAHVIAGTVASGVDAVLQVGGVISGTVTDSQGKPVGAMCIELIGSVPADLGYLGFATQPDGSYVINELSAGTYELGFVPGCGNSGNYAPYWYDARSSQSLATPIVVPTGGTQTINAQLTQGAAITGTVTSASGHGVENICVSAVTASQADLGEVVAGGATPRRDGAYQILDLAAGQYLVNFGCGLDTSYADQWYSGGSGGGPAELVSATPGRTTGIDVHIQPGSTISGVVTSSSGRPLAGVCADAINLRQARSDVEPPRGLGQPVTNIRGAYKISQLAAGSYHVYFSPCIRSARYAGTFYAAKGSPRHPGTVTVQAGKTASGISARLGVGGTISGRVVGAADQSLRNICVTASDPQTLSVRSAATGKAGTYTVPGLSTGSYTVEFSPCGSQNLVSVLAHANVTAPRATAGVDATMQAGGSIAGMVTATLSSGPAVSGSCVEVYSSNPDNPGGFAGTGPDGSYTVSGLAAGSYQVYFSDPLCDLPGVALAPQWYDGEPTQAKATPATVTAAGQTTASIDAVLQPDGEITGTVSGPADAAVRGACVTAVPLPAGLSPRIVAVSRTGGYTLADVLPGRYKVEFSSGCGATGYASKWWTNATSQAAARVITVHAGQDVSGISATLTR